MTPLDRCFAAMTKDGEDGTARLAFMHMLAASELHVPGGETPDVFETSVGRFVLAFDTEDRLAAFAQGVTERASLPGRVLAQALAGQGVGLIVNAGEASEYALDPDGLGWLARIATEAAVVDTARLGGISAPEALPPALLDALDRVFQRTTGMVRRAWLAEAEDGLVLALAEAMPGSEDALVRGLAEAVRFSDWDGTLSIAFPKDEALSRFERVGLGIEIAREQHPSSATKNVPPRLR